MNHALVITFFLERKDMKKLMSLKRGREKLWLLDCLRHSDITISSFTSLFLNQTFDFSCVKQLWSRPH